MRQHEDVLRRWLRWLRRVWVKGSSLARRQRGLKGAGRPWVVENARFVVLCGSLSAVIVLGIAVKWPQLFSNGLTGLTGKERADVLGSGRDFGLKLAAGIGAVAGAVLAWGRFELSKEERDVARLTVDAERFSRAVDQLGSDKGSDVVLGRVAVLMD